MKKTMRIGLVMSFAVLFCIYLPGLARLETPTGFAVTDLQLISTASKPDWGDNWSAPVEAATILAWFHEHGYSRLLPDLNGDGVVDELDTIELANILGKGPMKTDSPQGTSDALLVFGLARYVADKYPGKFELKIYDVGFPAEYARELHTTFASDVIPGITLTLKSEPRHVAYEYELRSAEGVILGIEEEIDQNYYFTGRSFLFEQTGEGYYPVDLVWGEEDRWKPEIQGQILETEAMETDALYLYYYGQWVKVEFMLALSPLVESGEGKPHGPCPEGAIGYDVTTSTTDYGDVEIEECVIREGAVDIYIYTVRNISFVKAGCGICNFTVPNYAGLPTVNQSGPPTWLINPHLLIGWEWQAPLHSCGIEIGQSAVFVYSVPAPTIDVPVTGYVRSCPHVLLISTNGESDATVKKLEGPPVGRPFRVQTTGPKEGTPDDGPEPGCPDLTIKIDPKKSCTCKWTGGAAGAPGQYTCEVDVHTTVKNIGNEPANHFYCKLESALGGDSRLIATLAPGAAKSVHFSFTFTLARGQNPPCPLKFAVMADSKETVDECIEANNFDSGDVCCQSQQDG